MNKRNIIHVSITFIVILLLIFTGPASAVKIKVSTPSEQYYSDETVTFTVDILFKTNDLIPIDRINITGLPKGALSFRPDGTIISGDAGYNVIRTSSAYYGYGYGYGYDQNPGYGYGYGYDFGYGYGYGYGYDLGYGYGYDYEYGYDYGYEKGDWKSKLSYEIEISGLASGMYSDTVNIYVLTGNAKKPSFASSEDYSFEIITKPPITAPVITNIDNTTPTTDSVTITWETDQDSDSRVKYGTASGTYTNLKSDAAMVTSHTIMLSGLNPDTTYYFTVNSTDASGNSSESEEYMFRTAIAASLSATRTLSGTMCPGSTVTVTNNLTVSGSPVEGLGISENLSDIPAEWTINVYGGGNYNPAARTVEFSWNDPAGNLGDKTVSYDMLIPEDVMIGEQYHIKGVAQLVSEGTTTLIDPGIDTLTIVECPEGILLQKGWNFISFPGVLSNATPEYVLNGLQIDVAMHYNTQIGSWETISEFVPGTAYGIKVSSPQTIGNLEYMPAVPPSLQLYEGWNPIGLIEIVPGTEKKYAETEFKLARIDGLYSKIVGPWDPELMGYLRTGYNQNVYGEIPGGETINKVYTENFPVKRYEGYWIYRNVAQQDS